jgi:hypothetical protein
VIVAQPACDFIREKFHGRSIFHAPMRKLTTIRVGGPVDTRKRLQLGGE